MSARVSVDNGTAFVSKAMDAWAYGHDVRLNFIRPGRPLENAFIESFNGRLRDECLNSHIFGSVAEAQALLDAWRDDYNRVRPHSALQDRTPVEWAQHVTESREARDSVLINKLGVDTGTTACSVTSRVAVFRVGSIVGGTLVLYVADYRGQVKRAGT